MGVERTFGEAVRSGNRGNRSFYCDLGAPWRWRSGAPKRDEQPRNWIGGKRSEDDGEWLSRCDVDDGDQNDTLQGHASIAWASVRRSDWAWKRWSVRNAGPEHWMSKPRYSNPLPIGET